MHQTFSDLLLPDVKILCCRLTVIKNNQGIYDSILSRGTRLWAAQSSVQISAWKRDFLFLETSRLTLGTTQLPIYWQPGTLSPVWKWPELQADHFIHLVSRLRMSWGKTLTLPIYLLGIHSLPSFNKCTLKVFPPSCWHFHFTK